MSKQTRREFLTRVGAAAAGAVALPAIIGGGAAGCGDEGGGGAEVNEAWEAMAATAEGAMIYDASTPWSDGTEKAGTHVPELSIDSFHGKLALIRTPHAISPDHYIALIYVRDQDGVIVGLEEFGPPSGESPDQKAEFELPESTTSVTAYSECNLHNVWKSEEVSA